MKAPEPIYLVTYEGAVVSDELGSLIRDVEYVDHTTGKSDELTLTLANHDQRWLNGWYPSDGDRIDVAIGYGAQPLLPCGTFRVTQVDMAGTPDTVQLRCLAAAVDKRVRTVQSRSFEDVTLREIGQLLARELELELVGEVPEVRLQRVTQAQETTLAFLRRLAREYGATFSIRGARLSMFEFAKLETSKPVLTLSRRNLRPGYRFSGKTQGTYAACEVTWLDPATKETRKARVEAEQLRQRVIIDGTGGGGTEGPPVVPSRVLKVGVTGEDVRGWQTFCQGKGNDPGPLDGIFGVKTRAGTLKMQRALGVTADGVVGPETVRAAVSAGFDLRSAAKGTRAENVAGNVLRKTIRVESVDQALVKARALLADANRLKVEGSLSLIGNTRVMAGVTLDLTDMGRLSGRFLVQTSRHKMSRSGYTTEVEVTRV